MIKKLFTLGILFLFTIPSFAQVNSVGEIRQDRTAESHYLPLTNCLYEVIDINAPGGDYQLNYTLENIGLSPYLSFLTLWFNSDNIRHFDFVSASGPSSWSYTKIGPYPGYNNWRVKFECFNPDDYIQPGEKLSGFSIIVNSFDVLFLGLSFSENRVSGLNFSFCHFKLLSLETFHNSVRERARIQRLQKFAESEVGVPPNNQLCHNELLYSQLHEHRTFSFT